MNMNRAESDAKATETAVISGVTKEEAGRALDEQNGGKDAVNLVCVCHAKKKHAAEQGDDSDTKPTAEIMKVKVAEKSDTLRGSSKHHRHHHHGHHNKEKKPSKDKTVTNETKASSDAATSEFDAILDTVKKPAGMCWTIVANDTEFRTLLGSHMIIYIF